MQLASGTLRMSNIAKFLALVQRILIEIAEDLPWVGIICSSIGSYALLRYVLGNSTTQTTVETFVLLGCVGLLSVSSISLIQENRPSANHSLRNCHI